MKYAEVVPIERATRYVGKAQAKPSTWTPTAIRLIGPPKGEITIEATTAAKYSGSAIAR